MSTGLNTHRFWFWLGLSLGVLDYNTTRRSTSKWDLSVYILGPFSCKLKCLWGIRSILDREVEPADLILIYRLKQQRAICQEAKQSQDMRKEFVYRGRKWIDSESGIKRLADFDHKHRPFHIHVFFQATVADRFMCVHLLAWFSRCDCVTLLICHWKKWDASHFHHMRAHQTLIMELILILVSWMRHKLFPTWKVHDLCIWHRPCGLI